jgi:alginate O-acetyltransferase complex protein AlgI
MLFNSSSFIFAFLPITVIVFFSLARVSHSVALLSLTAASFFFYMQMNVKYVYVLLPSIVFNYIIGVALSKLPRDAPFRLHLVIFGIAANLLCLFAFKYLDLFIESINAIGLFRLNDQKIELPLGISFFTFTQIAFLVDAYQRKVHETKFVSYALFVSYFPHLIAGPILHHSEMMPQFSAKSTYRARLENFAVGLTIFFIGLFKKVALADSIAPHVHKVFNAASQGISLTPLEGWSGALFYSLQIYFDFSGYSDMAIGLSLLFGVRLPLNFNSPYKAVNIVDFWRRWHMTLSRFLRDYLYFPLGGNRAGDARRLLNVMIVMLLGGLWHGASWTFVVWGGLHGVYLIVNHAWHLIIGKNAVRSHFSTAAGCLMTFVLVTFAWVFFRSPDMHTALAMVSSMLGQNGAIASTSTLLAAPNLPSVELALLAAGLLAIVWAFPNTQEIMALYKPALETSEIPRAPSFSLWRPNWRYAVIVGSMAVVSLTMIVYVKRVGDFIYFQF